LPVVHLGSDSMRVISASSTHLTVAVPRNLAAYGRLPVHVDGTVGESMFLDVAAPVATDLHLVDNPVFDRDGNLYVTFSGSRGERIPASLFRIGGDQLRRPVGSIGLRQVIPARIVNPTSMAIGPDGLLYVSSRFEGRVYRVAPDGTSDVFASDLGVACGLAFTDDGALVVGDRSGTIFEVAPDGRVRAVASLPPSVAAFHVALAPDGSVYVAAPTLASYDPIYRVDRAGHVQVVSEAFGRPQGLAFDRAGTLFVVEALAGSSGLYRLDSGQPELVLSAPSLVGLAFDSSGGLVVASNDAVYRVS
jgi:sugar lactone lactonase YvrE